MSLEVYSKFRAQTNTTAHYCGQASLSVSSVLTRVGVTRSQQCECARSKELSGFKSERIIRASMRVVLGILPIIMLMFLSTTVEAQTFLITGAEGGQCTGEYVGGKCIIQYDRGYVSVVVNNTNVSVSFNISSTPANVASSLAANIHTTLPSVTATASGSTISLSPASVFLEDGTGNTDFDAIATNVTTVTLSTSSSSVTYGTSVTFTASVPPSATGTVTFKDGGTPVGASTVSGGAAAFTTSALAAGSHAITASYSGDPHYTALTSSGITETVRAAAQSITVTTAAPSGAVYNGSFIVAANASSGLAVVYASSGGCTNSGATFTMTSGTTACTVTYSQSGNVDYSAAPNIVTTTNATLASQAITFPNPGTQTYGGPSVTLTATASSGLPVTYSVTSGPATVSGSTLTLTGAGTVVAVANQAGNANYANAAPVSLSFAVSEEATSVTLSTSSNSVVYGTALTLTATVPSAATGTVTFLDSGTSIGATTLSSGSATLIISTLGIGSHVLTASYSGDSNYTGANSSSLTETITQPLPSITGVSPSSGPAGTLVTITGSNLTFLSDPGQVQIAGQTATVVSWKTGSIVAWVPSAATAYVGDLVPVLVTVGSVSSNPVGFGVTSGAESTSPTCPLTQ